MVIIERDKVDGVGESRLRLQTIVRLRWVAVARPDRSPCSSSISASASICRSAPASLLIAMSAWLNVFLRMRYPSATA